jgi:hypothetical protein
MLESHVRFVLPSAGLWFLVDFDFLLDFNFLRSSSQLLVFVTVPIKPQLAV